jgi:hypothetical protein
MFLRPSRTPHLLESRYSRQASLGRKELRHAMAKQSHKRWAARPCPLNRNPNPRNPETPKP